MSRVTPGSGSRFRDPGGAVTMATWEFRAPGRESVSGHRRAGHAGVVQREPCPRGPLSPRNPHPGLVSGAPPPRASRRCRG